MEAIILYITHHSLQHPTICEEVYCLMNELPAHLPPFQLAHWVFSTEPSELHNFGGDAVSIIVVN